MFFLVNIIPANVDRLEMEIARFYKEESEEQAKKNKINILICSCYGLPKAKMFWKVNAISHIYGDSIIVLLSGFAVSPGNEEVYPYI